MPNTKGTNVVSVRRLLQAAAQEDAVLAQLTREDLESYRETLAVGWVSDVFIARLFAVAAPALYPREPKPIRQLGRTIAQDNLTGVYRVMLRIVSIPFAIERAGSLWRTYNDTGEATISRFGDEPRARMTITGYERFPDECLDETAGYIEGVALLCGAKVADAHPSRPTADSFAFDVTWHS
jgi:hypothetical protein